MRKLIEIGYRGYVGQSSSRRANPTEGLAAGGEAV